LGDIRTAMAHIDRVNATIAASTIAASAGPTLSTAEVTNAVTPTVDRFAPSAKEAALSEALQRIGGDLNSTVVRGMFEAALVLQSALQLDCEPGAVRRIESAIEVLDETIRETRMMVFALQASEAQPRRRD
jgi:signal transduction histidine kinase